MKATTKTRPEDFGLSFPGFEQPDCPPAWQGARLVDACLVLEGGAMRGQFTAGVLDCLMDLRIIPTTAIGVSAGALQGANYKAGMRGRSCFINLNFADDWRFFSYRSWLLKGNVFDVRYTFDDIPRFLVPFDYQAFRDSPVRLYSVATDLVNGLADYHQYSDLDTEMDYLRASASMPFASQVTQVGGLDLLDGGICDSIPIGFAQGLGLEKLLVVLTQPAGYIKQPNRLVGLARLVYRRYPRFVDALADRHNAYNQASSLVRSLEDQGKALVLRPSGDNPVSNMEHDRNKLVNLYREGYELANRRQGELAEYLGV